MGLGERLRKAREKAGLSASEVSRRLGRTRNAVTLWELEQRRVPAEDLARLAEIYGVSVDWLLGRTDEGGPTAEGRGAVKGERLLQEVDRLHFHTPGGSRPITDEEAAYLREIIRSVIEEYTREEKRRKSEREDQGSAGDTGDE